MSENKTKTKKVNPLSEGAINALKAISKGPATAVDLKAKGLENLNSAHLTALAKRGYVETEEVEIEVPAIIKRKVKRYTITEKGIKELG